ncbi:MAG: D-alanyl-D-alanine carboxypeptidase [Bacilli bacterium]|nr:D-alanyl-D-alanine carboxypeptidase [Bacilli bacterium]MDD4808712.1 D-alanyl-D-alanine carboxypeptidase [Bacilli bacterium]
MKKIVLCFLLVILMIPANILGEELTLSENSKSTIMLEASTGEIIYEHNSHEKFAPASMTKMMTMLLIVENIEKGVIGWNEMVTVSANASGMGGSQILLETNEKMSVDDLFKGIAVASGNDASVALAEKIAGTEANFVVMMNNRAKELGLKNTNFKNCHGLDAANHYSTAYDMAHIAKELVKHDKVLEYTKIYDTYLRENTDNKIWLVNTNKLVRFYDGVDGLKTGYTNGAGYCLTATAKKNNMRIISVVMGEPDSLTRNKEISEMLDYAFAQYEIETLLSTKSVLAKKSVEKGVKKYIELVPVEDVNVLHKKIDKKKIATYDLKIEKLKAPLKKGDVVGILTINDGSKNARTINITIKEDIKKANFIQLYARYLMDIVNGDIK